ncbi:MAG: prolyl oligopeptidase family serine peptidase [Dysgonamonadaceae bacterium]
MGEILRKKQLSYLVRPSSRESSPPLLILLHGARSNEEWMFDFADLLPEEFLVVSVRGPIQYGLKSFAWFELDESEESIANEQKLKDSIEQILSFIDEIIEKYQADPQRVILLGFSQGGISSYNIALTHPEKIKAIVVLGGRMLREIKPLAVHPKRIQQVKMFIGHGLQDRRLVFEKALEAADYLRSQGVNFEMHAYNDDHTINGEMIWDVNNWLAGIIND